MLKLTAYSNPIHVRPGESVQFKVSCDGLAAYNAQIVRIVCGDTSPEGPGYREIPVPAKVNRRYEGRFQPIHAGSHGEVPANPALDGLASFTVQAFIWPTTPKKGLQGIVSCCSEDGLTGFALVIDDTGALALRLGTGRGSRLVSTGRPLQERRWYLVSASYDARTRRATVAQAYQGRLARRYSAAITTRLREPYAPAEGRPLAMAGIATAAGADRLIVGNHYNGKIDRPRLANRALSEPEIRALCDGIPSALADAVVGAWDFARDIGSEDLSDISATGLQGVTVNLPAGAMTGANWTGEVMDWRVRPEEWGAIHFHDDDLYDAGWQTDFTWTIPGPGREAKIAFLMPTASYLAYANEHIATDGIATELTCNFATVADPWSVYLAEHREYGQSMYDLHSDGSGVCYSSRLRPVLNMRPKRESVLGGIGPSRLWQFNADTHILDWLEAKRHRYDVITDEELHERGLDLLSPYRVVVTGTHPEYWSTRMWDALEAWKHSGGRLMYLGGNGFYWRVAYHPALPGVIELRRNEGGIRAWTAQPGEYHHSFDGLYGGLWLNNGRAPQKFVGIGMCTQGFDISSYYRRKPDSHKPKVRFIFEGVGKDELIGDFGLVGGGAAGLELDRVEPALGSPAHLHWLASSEGHTDAYQLTVEELPETYPGLGGEEQGSVRADMVFFETENGGAVFSVGSMTWAGSLSHEGYDNNVSRITNNVLRRFLEARRF